MSFANFSITSFRYLFCFFLCVFNHFEFEFCSRCQAGEFNNLSRLIVVRFQAVSYVMIKGAKAAIFPPKSYVSVNDGSTKATAASFVVDKRELREKCIWSTF